MKDIKVFKGHFNDDLFNKTPVESIKLKKMGCAE